MHYDAAPNATSAVNWMTNPASKVSAHLHISRDGVVTQLAPFNFICWHAGQSKWNGLTGLNNYSIGIELQNTGKQDYTPVQIETALAISRALVDAYTLEDVLGHSDISPGRKIDPGVMFPMNRFKALLCVALVFLTLISCGTRRKSTVSETATLKATQLTEISQVAQSLTTDYFGDFINGRFALSDMLPGDTLAFESGGVAVKFTAGTNAKGEQTIGFDAKAKPMARTSLKSDSGHYQQSNTLEQSESKEAAESEVKTNPLTGWLWFGGLLLAVIIALVIIIKFK